MDAAHEAAAGPLDLDRPCLACGYNLKGLSTDGACPECGTPVANSLRGNLLEYSSPEYLAALHKGVFWVQAAIIFSFIALIAEIVGGPIFAATGGGTFQNFHLISSLVGFASSVMSLLGWWLLSSPDPAIIGMETGANARKVVRACTIIRAAAAVVSTLAVVGQLQPLNVRNPTLNAAQLLPLAVAAVGLIAWVVWYFAAMRYLCWLAPRIPNTKAHDRAKLLLWLGPLLYIVGSVVCGLGPLISLILYYNLLEWIRLDLRSLRRKQAADGRALS